MQNIKEITKQDYVKRMDRVLDYIQEHLDEELSLDRLSSLACFSQYHFHRIFSGMVGESVKAYVRRLRLERAASRLKQTKKGITEIAFEAGFETHESFTRAFKVMFGLSPKHFRQRTWQVRRDKNRKYWKETTMKVTLITLEAMDVAYIRHRGPYDQCGKAWDILCQWAGSQGLLRPGVKMLGLSYDDPQVTSPEKLRYDACIEVNTECSVEEVDSSIARKTIPQGYYAMTTHVGPYDTLADTYNELCGQWLPQNGYEIDSRACLEIYMNSPEETEQEDLITDIYIPLDKGCV